MKKIRLSAVLLLFCVISGCCVSGEKVEKKCEVRKDLRNLLVNSEFNFHPFAPHRTGKAGSFAADYVPFWNADTAKSLQVLRDSHIPKNVLPDFSVPCGVQLFPGQSFHQFFALPEADLLPGDAVSLNFFGYQDTPGAIKGELKAMKIETADGTWSPKDFKLRDQRTFNKMARGELVVAKSITSVSDVVGKTVEFKAENLVVPGNFTPGKKSYSKDCNTVGIEVRFTNTSKKNVWIFCPRSCPRQPEFQSHRKLPEHPRILSSYSPDNAEVVER